MSGLFSLPILLATHIAQLQIMPDEEFGVDFLQDEGDARSIRRESIPAYRGLITDRNGEPLAVSTPVTSLIANPKLVNKLASEEDLIKLSNALEVSFPQLSARLKRYRNKSFMYLARQLPVNEAQRVLDLGISGVEGRQEFKRFYPAGEVTSQLVGFTNIDEVGIEGMELSYNEWLTGKAGSKKVIKDNKGRVIKDLSLIKPAHAGENLRLSIDLRIQYAAHRALKKAVDKHNAKSGSVVVLDVETGEVLAMVNQPSFNPNDRSELRPDSVRNRTMTDMMEPGSTVKPFTILAALESGKFEPNTTIDTHPGYLKVDYKELKDQKNYGLLDLAGIISKSSNVGTSKIALQLNPNETRELFERVGFGENSGSGFPGETSGSLPAHRRWDPVTQATFSFGYGLHTSSLQMARAYGVLASNGVRKEVSLLSLDSAPEGVRIIDEGIANEIRYMLHAATGKKGTGSRAAIKGYSVGGKTGTLHKINGAGGYHESVYMSAFAGFSPIDNPRLVTVVVVDEPSQGGYFGGVVAAPVFSEVTGNALRLMQVTPDQVKANGPIVKRSDAVLRGES
ncbi:penicillin-binding transpeptidase domain-containing protein [Porticoccaceae bacterium]|nr:penicillin-binding transpeptidase domain-containing protein [Porticoccaceae bacterium]